MEGYEDVLYAPGEGSIHYSSHVGTRPHRHVRDG